MSSDSFTEGAILASWQRNARPWIDAVRGAQAPG
jgi:hypothetical protein